MVSKTFQINFLRIFSTLLLLHLLHLLHLSSVRVSKPFLSLLIRFHIPTINERGLLFVSGESHKRRRGDSEVDKERRWLWVMIYWTQELIINGKTVFKLRRR